MDLLKARKTYIVKPNMLLVEVFKLIDNFRDICLTISYWDKKADRHGETITSDINEITLLLCDRVVNGASFTMDLRVGRKDMFENYTIDVKNHYIDGERFIKIAVMRNDAIMVTLTASEVLAHLESLKGALVPALHPLLKTYVRAYKGLCKQNPWSCEPSTFEPLMNSLNHVKYWIPDDRSIGRSNHYAVLMSIHKMYPVFNYQEVM